MKVLALLYPEEVSKLDVVKQAFAENHIALEVIVYRGIYEGACAQQQEIIAAIKLADAIVFFASNRPNECLDLAINEAAHLGKKVVCIQERDEDALVGGFVKFGDGLVHSVPELLDEVLGSSGASGWTNVDSSAKEDDPFARYKCGNKK